MYTGKDYLYEQLKILNREFGLAKPTYFIADIAANHNGELSKALDLITMCSDAGADAAKFQHFRADHIVSDKGFTVRLTIITSI